MNQETIKAEFARRLQALLTRKNWSQSDLARFASAKLPKPTVGQKRGREIGRDLISHYIRGKMLPMPGYLKAIADALGVDPQDLLPAATPHVSAPGDSPFSMRQTPDGRVHIQLNRSLSAPTAMKIMALLAEEDKLK